LSFGFQVSGLEFGVSGFEFRVSGFGFRVSGFGFQVLEIPWLFASARCGSGFVFRGGTSFAGHFLQTKLAVQESYSARVF